MLIISIYVILNVKKGLFNCYYNDFENLLLKYLKFNIIEFNSF